jgi:CBS domain-containing protein
MLIPSSGDRPLREALLLLDQEGVTSLAVVDNQYNVVGNISTVDVKVRLMLPSLYELNRN